MAQKNFKRLILISGIVFIILNVTSIINLLLNKKYVVQEISETTIQNGLIGIQELVEFDYKSIIILQFFNFLFFLFLIYTIIKSK